jgi:hypothetical protein
VAPKIGPEGARPIVLTELKAHRSCTVNIATNMDTMRGMLARSPNTSTTVTARP